MGHGTIDMDKGGNYFLVSKTIFQVAYFDNKTLNHNTQSPKSVIFLKVGIWVGNANNIMMKHRK